MEIVGGFWARAARAVRTGRRRPKGAAQFACTLETLLHHKVKVIAPALTDRQFCQTVAYTAALPTVRWLCQTKAALPDLGAKDPAPWQKRLCQWEEALPTSGGGLAKAAIMELRLHSRDASGLRECGRLGLRWWCRRPGLPISWNISVAIVAEILTTALMPCYTC